MDLQDEQQKPAALPLPVVPRLDRLDLLIQLLEEKQKLQKKQGSFAEGEKAEDAGDDGYKPVSAALEEVHFKGTLMDRIAMLENRVLLLSLQMDVGSTSRSSSFHAVPVQEKIITSGGSDDRVDGPRESFRLQNTLEPPKVIQEVGSKTSSVTTQGCGYRRWTRKAPGRSRKKLFEWLQI